jgi:hypothetical protein
VAAIACGPTEPVQKINFNKGRLSMDLSQKWVLQRDSGKKAYYRLGDSEDVRLSFEDQSRDYGTPMTVRAVKGSIGSELNLQYGGVDARLSYGGNALLTYEREVKEGRKKVFTHNWVVAHPLGATAIARVAITLKVPAGQQNSPDIAAVIDLLDKQVGDATIPEV